MHALSARMVSFVCMPGVSCTCFLQRSGYLRAYSHICILRLPCRTGELEQHLSTQLAATDKLCGGASDSRFVCGHLACFQGWGSPAGRGFGPASATPLGALADPVLLLHVGCTPRQRCMAHLPLPIYPHLHPCGVCCKRPPCCYVCSSASPVWPCCACSRQCARAQHAASAPAYAVSFLPRCWHVPHQQQAAVMCCILNAQALSNASADTQRKQ